MIYGFRIDTKPARRLNRDEYIAEPQAAEQIVTVIGMGFVKGEQRRATCRWRTASPKWGSDCRSRDGRLAPRVAQWLLKPTGLLAEPLRIARARHAQCDCRIDRVPFVVAALRKQFLHQCLRRVRQRTHFIACRTHVGEPPQQRCRRIKANSTADSLRFSAGIAEHNGYPFLRIGFTAQQRQAVGDGSYAFYPLMVGLVAMIFLERDGHRDHASVTFG